MDLQMPVMDGVEATRRIMASCPVPILVVTASLGRSYGPVFEAMGAGALDAVRTPALSEPSGQKVLLAKIETLASLIFAPARREEARPPGGSTAGPERSGKLVVLGASAGGPAAVSEVLRGLGRGFPAALVIVQHVDSEFMEGLSSWLAESSGFPVRIARSGDVPRDGEALLAGGAGHLVFSDRQELRYAAEPAASIYKPSIDVLFESAAKLWSGVLAGVLLTGMGRDGAQGLLAIRTRGCHTFAQDRATSAVYGMPKAAFELNAAERILPLDSIGPALAAWAGGLS
jgi:chemotaxis response regulator CheB